MDTQPIVVYISDDCEQCDHVITFLNNLGFHYKTRNTSKDKAYMRELHAMNLYSTPVTIIDKIKVLGFQRNRLRHILGIKSNE